MSKIPKVYIGIDQSLRSSGVFWLGDGVVGWARIETKKLRGTERLKYIKDALVKILDVDLEGYSIGGLCMEGYSYGARGRVFELGELGGVLKISLHEHAVDVISIPPTQLKKFTGNGKAEKEDVVKFVNKQLNMSFTVKDNDVCDAAVLALIAQQLTTPTTTIRAQLEVLQTIKDTQEG